MKNLEVLAWYQCDIINVL